MNNLYTFLDESGDFVFFSKGTKYLVLTSVTTHDIRPLCSELYDLKHNLILRGSLAEYFHAYNDNRSIRNEVFCIIGGCDHFRVDTIVVDKPKTPPALQAIYRFYPRVMQELLKVVYQSLPPRNFEQVVVFMDYIHLPGKREAFMKGAKEAVRPYLRKSQEYRVMLHQSKSHPYLQIADYCGWAISRRWERSDQSYHNRIKHLIKSEFLLQWST